MEIFKYSVENSYCIMPTPMMVPALREVSARKISESRNKLEYELIMDDIKKELSNYKADCPESYKTGFRDYLFNFMEENKHKFYRDNKNTSGQAFSISLANLIREEFGVKDPDGRSLLRKLCSYEYSPEIIEKNKDIAKQRSRNKLTNILSMAGEEVPADLKKRIDDKFKAIERSISGLQGRLNKNNSLFLITYFTSLTESALSLGKEIYGDKKLLSSYKGRFDGVREEIKKIRTAYYND